MPGPTKHQLVVGGQSVAFWTYHDPTKPTIVMIHGFRGTHHGLDLIAKYLPGYHLVVPDLPGFGVSQPLVGEHNLANYVQWLANFISALKLSQPPILLGHSFGSIVTAAYASAYPITISKLILINPIGAPALNGPKAILTKLAIGYYLIGQKLPPQFARRWLSNKAIVLLMSRTMAKTRDRPLRAFINDQHLRHFSSFASPRVVAEAFTTSTTNTVRDSAASVSTATLLIAGERDDITSLSHQRQLAELFPRASLKIIPAVGHLTHYETPNQVARLIDDFIG